MFHGSDMDEDHKIVIEVIAFIIAFVQGGVVPQWQQGSKFTYNIAPLTLDFAL